MPTRRSRSSPAARRRGCCSGLATFGGPHLLILDEPTNHLDIDSRAALIEAINDYPGAVILVSHDRHLLEACADRLWLVADGKVTPFDGDLDDYRRRVLSDATTATGARRTRAPSRRAIRHAQERGRGARAGAKPLRQRVERAEAEIDAADPRNRDARRGARRRRAVRARPGEGRGARQDARRNATRSPRPKRTGSRPAPNDVAEAMSRSWPIG